MFSAIDQGSKRLRRKYPQTTEAEESPTRDAVSSLPCDDEKELQSRSDGDSLASEHPKTFVVRDLRGRGPVSLIFTIKLPLEGRARCKNLFLTTSSRRLRVSSGVSLYLPGTLRTIRTHV